MIQPSYLWRWLIWFCERPALSFFRTELWLPFCLANQHNISEHQTHLNTKSPGSMAAAASRNLLQAALFACAFFSRVFGFVKLNLYESCIRSSAPIRYWLFISQTEWKRSFVSNPCFFDSISFGFHYAKVTLGLWSVTRDFWAEPQQCVFFRGCAREGEEAAALPTPPLITWADCGADRKAGRRPRSPSIRASLKMVGWECSGNQRALPGTGAWFCALVPENHWDFFF